MEVSVFFFSQVMLGIFSMYLLCLNVYAANDPKKCINDECEEKGKMAECPYPPPNLGNFDVSLEKLSLDDIYKKTTFVQIGGNWKPTNCHPRQKVAIIVPYRKRFDDLLIFLNNIHRFLKIQLIEYCIYLVEQNDSKHFNRASLLNVGYVESQKAGRYDCVIFHDVDKFPEDTRNLYMCSDKPTHLITKQKYIRANYRERPYDDYFGGVTAISSDNFEKVNGFSNVFWGWGSEDDDFLARLRHHKLKTHRVAEEIGRFQEIYHPYGFVNPRRHEIKADGKRRFASDGLNSLNYSIVDIEKAPLFTRISIDLLDEDPYEGR